MAEQQEGKYQTVRYRKDNLEQQIRSLQRRLNSPKTDLVEVGNTYVVRMELPVRKFEWDVKDEQFLFVTADKDKEIVQENAKDIYRESRYGRMMRRVKLPSLVKTTPLSEEWENGIFIIKFEKKENVEVQTNELANELSIDSNTAVKSWSEL
jgi:HSP20 family molecular chaperone IbpA